MQGRLAAACVLGVLALTSSGTAQDDNCRSFAWSVGRTIDLFDEPLPNVRSGQSVPKEGAFALNLLPVADVIYPVSPDRGSDGGRGAVVTVETIPAGRYQIALSAEAWVDVIQENRHLPTTLQSQDKRCPGVRRSVEVEVKSLPLTLELGGAQVDRINIAVLRLWPFKWQW
ncbi:MAG TPA: hypothetical protein VFB13_19335 [Reyranella sp.]|jgi:hypothetical protein|nr:hypothetical protein [Reyranella sp.]